jgi:hypothetical protein
MYQKIKSMFEGLESKTVKRLSDNAFIPFDPDNTDYQQYLEWLSEGNEPLPADEPTQGETV